MAIRIFIVNLDHGHITLDTWKAFVLITKAKFMKVNASLILGLAALSRERKGAGLIIRKPGRNLGRLVPCSFTIWHQQRSVERILPRVRPTPT